MKQDVFTPARKGLDLGGILRKNAVPIVFLILCSVCYYYARVPFFFFANDLITRLSRNSFMVISLIIPVLAGVGLNFGIVLGAMAGQFGAIVSVVYNVGGVPGILLSGLVALPLAILFGVLTGMLFNRAKGKEMITGMILGYFANGLYQLVCLFMVGTVIHLSDVNLLLPSGVGLINTIDLKLWHYALDKMYVFKVMRMINIPVVTLTIVAVLCFLVNLLFKTKLGQDLRAVGQNRQIAEVAGINVNKVRIIAIVFSTVLAAWGQIIFLQNMGNLNTYGSHVQVGTFAVAALLIGGASVSQATIKQAIVGTILFHSLFILSPMAGKNLMGSAQVGEFFRVFVAYGVIGIALALHAWQRRSRK
ncbi:MAG: ABC transporter permease [Pyramidobacter sp.]|nr:ABC transporter permease [Pyramidobacter sp.]